MFVTASTASYHPLCCLILRCWSLKVMSRYKMPWRNFWLLLLYDLYVCVYMLIDVCVSSGWLWGSISVSRARQAVVPGGNRELGRGLCQTEPPRRLHAGGQIHRLDSSADQGTGLTNETYYSRELHDRANAQEGGFRPEVCLQIVVMTDGNTMSQFLAVCPRHWASGGIIPVPNLPASSYSSNNGSNVAWKKKKKISDLKLITDSLVLACCI